MIYQVSKYRRLIFLEGGEIRSSGEEKITHVVLCVDGGGVTCSPQAPMKMVWNPLLPQINIAELCESLCPRHRLNQPWVLQWDRMFDYMLINPSRDVVVSLACYSYSKSVKLGDSNPWRMTL